MRNSLCGSGLRDASLCHDCDGTRERGEMSFRYVSPPNWPPPPAGWVPPAGWQPPPQWPPAPTGWQFWVRDAVIGMASAPVPVLSAAVPVAIAAVAAGGPSTKVAEVPDKVSVFGARQKVRELTEELADLRRYMSELGALDVLELQNRREALSTEMAATQERMVSELAAHGERLQALTDRQVADSTQRLAALNDQIAAATDRLTELKSMVAVTEEAAILQEVGVYVYRHPLTDAAAYQAELKRLQDSTKAMTRVDGGAIESSSSWTVNGSAVQGRTMVREYSKLMLRAYNAEADNLVRALKPYKLATTVDRLDKVAATIERLGKTMSIRIAATYHQLRVKELELTADFLEKVAIEKEHEREEKVRLREERLAQAELQRERARLDTEQQHYVNALAALEAKNDPEGAERLRTRLADVNRAIGDVDYRAANIRAGYVYVISNVGSFGDSVIKVGMTRRLDPRVRVRELSDASVPFNFDVHALFFSPDAVGIEAKMHQLLAARRVNRVNHRREFFYATPAEARSHLLALTGEILEFTELPEAVEYQQSANERDSALGQSADRHQVTIDLESALSGEPATALN